MTEYIIIAMLIGIGSIGVYTKFGDVSRNQTSAAAKALAGLDGSYQTANAQNIATQAGWSTNVNKGMGNAANHGSNSTGSNEGDGNNGNSENSGNNESNGNSGNSENSGNSGNSENGTNGENNGPTLFAPGDPGTPPVPPPPGCQNLSAIQNDADVMALVNASSTLKQGVQTWIDGNKQIIYDNTIDGSAQVEEGFIKIHPNVCLNSKSTHGDARNVLTLLAHEIGHNYANLTPDTSSEANYVNSLLLSEADATLYGLKVRDEICIGTGGTALSSCGGGIDIVVAVPEGLGATVGVQFYEIYRDYALDDISLDDARAQIAAIYRTLPQSPGKTYEQEYKEQYQTGKSEGKW